MAILSSIERRALRYRILLAVIYVLLIAGAATMVYPFLLMVSGSMKSDVDIGVMDPLPRYLFDDKVLFKKFLESKYNCSWHQMNVCLQSNLATWEQPLPHGYPVPINPPVVADYEHFLADADFPPHWIYLGHFHNGKFTLANSRRATRYLRHIYDDDLSRFNRENTHTYHDWNIQMPIERWHVRRYEPDVRPFARYLDDFKYERPRSEWGLVNVDGVFQSIFLRREYQDDIDRYNATHQRQHRAFDEIPLNAAAPTAPAERRDWVRFVCRELNIVYVRARPQLLVHFRRFLGTHKYQNNISILNQAHGTSYRDFSEVPFPDHRKMKGAIIADWKFFLDKAPGDEEMIDVLAANLEVDTPCTSYRRYLRERYNGDINALNRAYALSYSDFGELMMPVWQYDAKLFQGIKSSFRRECMGRNFRRVFDFVVVHGRGVLNTTIYCILAVATALLVNPLAAYALSRFGLPTTYKILLFLMATMAFPVEVTMIPSFLLLRQLNLLNTFFALVLPGAASGFAIFLLKGFFDSLPRELYESATIDGAGEWTMFWVITMALSKPILAVIALGAFTGAYSAFMFAMIICPDPKMWTLMVHLYELQAESHQAVVYASLIIGSVPTFLVFLFCQNIIMRGIVVPTEK